MVQIFLCLHVLYYPNYLKCFFFLNPVNIANFLVSFELEILQIFRRVRKITKSCYWLHRVCQPAFPSVRPSVRMEQLGSHRSDFHDFWYSSIFRNSVKTVKFHWHLKTMTGTLNEDVNEFMAISVWILLIMRNITNKKCRKNQDTFLCATIFFWNSCRLWDNVENMVEPDISQMTISHMRFPRWIPKSTYTHPEHVMLIAFARH
jgi:hypothetical protein